MGDKKNPSKKSFKFTCFHCLKTILNNKNRANFNLIGTISSPNYCNTTICILLSLPLRYLLLKLFQYPHPKKSQKLTNCSEILVLSKPFQNIYINLIFNGLILWSNLNYEKKLLKNHALKVLPFPS